MLNCEQIIDLINSSQWSLFEMQLSHLSNREFRRVEHTVCEVVLPRLNNDRFWDALCHLIIYNRHAFLAGARAVGHLAKDGSLSFGASAQQLAAHMKEKEQDMCTKIVDIMMPHLTTLQQMEDAFATFGVESPRSRLAILLKVESPMAYYLLFQNLKMMDDCKPLAVKCCQFIMKRQNDMAFNMVCLLKEYFDLDVIASRFSLQLQPYELNYVDKNYQTFLSVLEGKKPKV